MTRQKQVRAFGPGRPRRGEREPLSRALVVEEALRFVDEQGVSSLSMRKLAQRLGVEAMSLYAYVESKDDLLTAVANRVASEVSLPATERGDWQGRIRAAVAAWAGMEERHPGAFPLLYRYRTPTDQEQAVNEEIMDALSAAGFDSGTAALAYQTLVSFLDGVLLQWPRSRWRPPPNWEWVASNVDGEAFPRLVSASQHGAQLTWDDVFYTGLDLFLRGLECYLLDKTGGR